MSPETRGTNRSTENFLNVRTTVGEASQRSALSVTDTAQQLSVAAGKATIEIFNSGDKTVYVGGLGVDSTTGIPIFVDEGRVFATVKPDFNIYVVCAAGETSTLRIVEYT